jgi:hypothetical protein
MSCYQDVFDIFRFRRCQLWKGRGESALSISGMRNATWQMVVISLTLILVAPFTDFSNELAMVTELADIKPGYGRRTRSRLTPNWCRDVSTLAYGTFREGSVAYCGDTVLASDPDLAIPVLGFVCSLLGTACQTRSRYSSRRRFG